MKKGIALVLGAAFIMALGFTSCKKDYTCECTTTFTAGGIDPQVVSFTFNDTKKNAEAACEGKVVSVPGATMTCELK